MSRSPAYVLPLLLAGVLTACGGGGGGGSSSSPAPAPAASDPEPEPVILELIDALPADNATNIDPSHTTISYAHPGQSDLAITHSGDCDGFSAVTIRHSLLDMASPDFDQVLDHKVRCTTHAEATNYTFTADGTRDNDARFRATLEFSTGNSSAESPMTVSSSWPWARPARRPTATA